MSDRGTRWQEECSIEDTTSQAAPGERPQASSEAATAVAEMSPVGSAARTAYLAIAANIGTTELSLEVVVAELGEQVEGVTLDKDLRRGKVALAAQAGTLNLIYNLLAQRGIAAATSGKTDQADVLFRLALRTQARCQSTWATLHAMASPPVARQTHIALLNQQVNNGQVAPASDSQAQNPQSKVLEQTTHEPDAWLVRSAPGAAASSNSTVEAVATFNRTKIR